MSLSFPPDIQVVVTCLMVFGIVSVLCALFGNGRPFRALLIAIIVGAILFLAPNFLATHLNLPEAQAFFSQPLGQVLQAGLPLLIFLIALLYYFAKKDDHEDLNHNQWRLLSALLGLLLAALAPLAVDKLEIINILQAYIDKLFA